MFSYFLSAKVARFEHEYLKQQDWLGDRQMDRRTFRPGPKAFNSACRICPHLLGRLQPSTTERLSSNVSHHGTFGG